MKFATNLACVALAFSACDSSLTVGEEAEQTVSVTSRVAQTKHVSDRVQSSYLSTYVRLADRRTLTRGHARLELAYAAGKPSAKLVIEAESPAELWHAQIALDPSEVVSQASNSMHVRAEVQHSRGADRTTARSMGRLSLLAVRHSGRRTVFRGHLRDSVADSTLAEFQTELDVRCAVSPEMVRGEAEPDLDASALEPRVLVYDTELISTFCSQFRVLI